MMKQFELTVPTPGRGLVLITDHLSKHVSQSGVTTGLCHVFLKHTSASLIINENADPLVRDDLNAFMLRLVPDADAIYQHTLEGPDDMPAHVRSILTQPSVTVPITNGCLGLGVWQGVFVWEHRIKPHDRQLLVTIQGE